MVKYVLTEEQEEKLHIFDLERWNELNEKGYEAVKERMAILRKSGLKISDIKKE